MDKATLDRAKADMVSVGVRPRRILSDSYKGISVVQAMAMAEEIGRELCGDRFQIGTDNSEAYLRAVTWVLGDRDNGVDPDKGLYIYGPTGTGKSVMVSVLHELSHRLRAHFLRYDIRKQEEVYAPLLWAYRNAPEYVELYDGSIPQWLKYTPIICINDLGTEVHAKFYGKEVDVISELIGWRTDNRWQDHKMIITTNLTSDELQQYGTRTISRITGYCNLIALRGRDLRQNYTTQ